MSPDEFCTYVRKKVGADVKDEEIFRAWNKMLVGIPARRMQPSVICGRITALICSVIRMPCTGHIHAVN